MAKDPATAQEAERLFQQQVELEGRLESTMALINELKEGGVSSLLINAGDIYKAYDFVSDLKDHKAQVKQFEAVSQGQASGYAGAGMFGTTPMLVLGALAAGAAYLWKVKK